MGAAGVTPQRPTSPPAAACAADAGPKPAGRAPADCKAAAPTVGQTQRQRHRAGRRGPGGVGRRDPRPLQPGHREACAHSGHGAHRPGCDRRSRRPWPGEAAAPGEGRRGPRAVFTATCWVDEGQASDLALKLHGSCEQTRNPPKVGRAAQKPQEGTSGCRRRKTLLAREPF